MKKISYYVTLITLFLIPIFPLIIANSFFFPFITGKAFFFRILVEVAFAGWIILAFIDPKYRPKLTPLTIGVSVFALVTLIADLLGVNPIRSIWSNFERMEGWITIIHLWAFFMVTTSFFGSNENGKKLWHKWLNISLVVALIVSIYGIFQLFGWADIHQGSVRLDASLGNAAYMAVYMMIHAFLAAYMFFVNKIKVTEMIRQGKVKPTIYKFYLWVYGIMAVLFAFIVFETQTRGTILGLIGGIMLALTLYAIFGRNETKKSRWISIAIMGAIILIGVVFWMNRDSQFVRDNEIFNRLGTISWNDTKTQARGYVWPMAVNGALERPIFGWGQENFNYVFNANYNPKMWSQEQWFDRAHSVFLDWLVATGFVGLLSYLALYVLFLLVIWKSSLTITEKSVLTGLLAGYAVHNIFVFDNLASYVLFFSILGFANSLREGKTIKWFGTNPIRMDAVEYIVLPIVAIALILSLYFFNIRLITANTRLIKALSACAGGTKPDSVLFEKALSVNAYTANQEIREQAISCAGVVISSPQISNDVRQAFFNMAVKEIEAQKTITPKDARIYVIGGSFFNSVGQAALALPLLEKAHELTPRKQSASLMLATSYLNSGKNAEAVSLMKEAYESAPENTRVRTMYVSALVLSGKESEARKMFGDEQELFINQQMAQIYASLKQYSKAISVYETLIKNNPTDVNLRAQLAQTQYVSGQISNAIATLRSIEKDRPDLKEQIEAAIKQVQER